MVFEDGRRLATVEQAVAPTWQMNGYDTSPASQIPSNLWRVMRVPGADESGSDNDKRRSALILYGSETGNAQDVADEIGRLTERLRFDTTVLDLDSIELVRRASVVVHISAYI